MTDRYEFTAKSGNHAVVKVLIIGNRAATDVTWDEHPSKRDRKECEKHHGEWLNAQTGYSVILESHCENDPAIRARMYRNHMAGGQG